MLHGSGLHSQVDYTRLHEDDGDPDDIGGAESGARRKKAKFSRSRIACLPVRPFYTLSKPHAVGVGLPAHALFTVPNSKEQMRLHTPGSMSELH